MNKDLHPTIGPKWRDETLEDALSRVRQVHPCATMEGSTGRERSFWIGQLLVGHAWAVARHREAMWVRVAPKSIEANE